MSARGRGRKNHRTKRSPDVKIGLPISSLEELELEISSTQEYRKRCIEYLESELVLALGAPGNDVIVLRLLKGIDERHSAALVLAASQLDSDHRKWMIAHTPGGLCLHCRQAD